MWTQTDFLSTMENVFGSRSANNVFKSYCSVSRHTCMHLLDGCLFRGPFQLPWSKRTLLKATCEKMPMLCLLYIEPLTFTFPRATELPLILKKIDLALKTLSVSLSEVIRTVTGLFLSTHFTARTGWSLRVNLIKCHHRANIFYFVSVCWCKRSWRSSGKCLTIDWTGVLSPGRSKGFFPLASVSRPVLRSTQLRSSGYRGSFPRGKARPECDANHSPEVNNE
jgi:hypothetical protein